MIAEQIYPDQERTIITDSIRDEAKQVADLTHPIFVTDNKKACEFYLNTYYTATQPVSVISLDKRFFETTHEAASGLSDILNRTEGKIACQVKDIDTLTPQHQMNINNTIKLLKNGNVQFIFTAEVKEKVIYPLRQAIVTIGLELAPELTLVYIKLINEKLSYIFSNQELLYISYIVDGLNCYELFELFDALKQIRTQDQAERHIFIQTVCKRYVSEGGGEF